MYIKYFRFILFDTLKICISKIYMHAIYQIFLLNMFKISNYLDYLEREYRERELDFYNTR